MRDFNGLMEGDSWLFWHDRHIDKLERRIEPWAHKWRLAPRLSVDSKGAVRHPGYAQYPATMLLPLLPIGFILLICARGGAPGNLVASLCLLLDLMLAGLVYCFAKRRVAVLLPEIGADEVIRIARFVLSPAFALEALRIALAFAIMLTGGGYAHPTFRNVLGNRQLLGDPTELLTLIAFAVVVARVFYTIRQLDKRRAPRVILANGVLLTLALALSYCVAGLGFFWGMYAMPDFRLA